MMKLVYCKKISLIFLFASFFFTCACRVAEIDLECNYAKIDAPIITDGKIYFTGFCMHSAYVVDKVTMRKDASSVNVRLKCTPSYAAEKEKTGSFSFSVDLTDDLLFVTFGKENAVIWARK